MKEAQILTIFMHALNNEKVSFSFIIILSHKRPPFQRPIAIAMNTNLWQSKTQYHNQDSINGLNVIFLNINEIHKEPEVEGRNSCGYHDISRQKLIPSVQRLWVQEIAQE